MIVWHVARDPGVQALSSGRAAILGYTMPIFSALWGVALFGERLRPRHLAGIAAAGLGVALLLWHEFGAITGRPLAAVGMLVAAAVWALGTQQMRRTAIQAPTLAIVFWMTLAQHPGDERRDAAVRARPLGRAAGRDLGRDRLQRAADLRLRPGDLADAWRATCRRSPRACR